MNNITLADQFRATRTQSDIERLLALDNVWTRFLERPGQISREQVASLHSLAEEMRRLLASCGSDAKWLHQTFSRHQEKFELTWRELATEVTHDERRKQAMDKLERKGGIAALGPPNK
jgi:hypothetical protein